MLPWLPVSFSFAFPWNTALPQEGQLQGKRGAKQEYRGSLVEPDFHTQTLNTATLLSIHPTEVSRIPLFQDKVRIQKCNDRNSNKNHIDILIHTP